MDLKIGMESGDEAYSGNLCLAALKAADDLDNSYKRRDGSEKI